MKVLLVNGSSNKHGCTFTALTEITKTLNAQGIETEIFQLGNAELRDCGGCGFCRKPENKNKCAFEDGLVNEFIEKAGMADGFIFGSPVYYAHPSGRLLSFMDRVFYAGGSNFAYKPAAAIVSARRAGTTASLDIINKYFTINNMPVVPSNYWNMVHGGQNKPEDVKKDEEGMQVMRNLGLNMAWILKCLEVGKISGIDHPTAEERVYTNFVR